MTLTEIKTESVTKLVDGSGDAVDIKESRVTITDENKVSEASGQLYSKAQAYIGSYSYSRFGGINVNSSDTNYDTLQLTTEVLAYLTTVESQSALSA